MAIVYKYYAWKSHNMDALKKGYFFFCKAKNENDPYEASLKLLNNPDLREELFKKFNLDPNAEDIMREYGICCFSRDKASKQLWANYAEKYSGFVVGYEDTEFVKMQDKYRIRLPYVNAEYVKELPLFNNEFQNLMPQYVYPEEPSKQIYLSEVRDDAKAADQFFVRLLSIKEEETWSKEKEVRLIACRDITERDIDGIEKLETGYKIPFPKACVREIIFGHNCQKYNDFLAELKSIYPQIQVFKTKCDEPFIVDLEEI